MNADIVPTFVSVNGSNGIEAPLFVGGSGAEIDYFIKLWVRWAPISGSQLSV